MLSVSANTLHLKSSLSQAPLHYIALHWPDFNGNISKASIHFHNILEIFSKTVEFEL